MNLSAQITVFNLFNADNREIQNGYYSSDLSKKKFYNTYLDTLFSKYKNSKVKLSKLFIINGILLAHSIENNMSELVFNEIAIKELKTLTPLSLNKFESHKANIIDWLHNPHRSKPILTHRLYEAQLFGDFQENKNLTLKDFCIVINVVELGFKLRDFFAPLNQKFKQIHQFFYSNYNPSNVLKSVNLNNVYILDKYIIGYDFQFETSIKSHFFFNIYLDDLLNLIEPKSLM